MSGTRSRSRRTKAEIEAFDFKVYRIALRVQPATCRQIYYRAVVAGIVDKDDRGYRLVCKSLTRHRCRPVWGGTGALGPHPGPLAPRTWDR